MSIVSNSSALINLAHIGRLYLLQQLYREVTIPGAVWHEVVVEGAGQVGADIVKDATWIKTIAVTNKDLVRALQQVEKQRGQVLILDKRLVSVTQGAQGRVQRGFMCRLGSDIIE